MNLVLPRQIVIPEEDQKVIFLAGPISGGDNWQESAIDFLTKQVPDVLIACPLRYPKKHRLAKESLTGVGKKTAKEMGLEDASKFNTIWENFYLEAAAKNGVVFFWLPEESKENPRPKDHGPYARDSYGEFGEWRTRKALVDPDINLVVGAEEGFSGLHVMKRNVHKYNPFFKFCTSLTETLLVAIIALRES